MQSLVNLCYSLDWVQDYLHSIKMVSFLVWPNTLKKAETTKRTEVVAASGIPLATNYGSVSKVETDTGNSSGMAVGQTVNYSASNLPDSSSWAADARVVQAVGQNYGAALGQSVF